MKKLVVFLLLLFIWGGGYEVYHAVKKDYYCSVVFPESKNIEDCLKRFKSLDSKGLSEFKERTVVAKSGSSILKYIWIFISVFLSATLLFLYRKIKFNGVKNHE